MPCPMLVIHTISQEEGCIIALQLKDDNNLEQPLQGKKRGYEQHLQDQWLQGESALPEMKQEITSLNTNFALLIKVLVQMGQKMDTFLCSAARVATIEPSKDSPYLVIADCGPNNTRPASLPLELLTWLLCIAVSSPSFTSYVRSN